MPQGTASTEYYPVIVIGAGQAGIAVSYHLQQRGIGHLVLEKARPFADWHNHRWDSFTMNTPNWMNKLPGEKTPFAPQANRGEYGTRQDALDYFENYVHAVNPPIRIETVERLQQSRDERWRVTTNAASYDTDDVVICTGNANHAKVPPIAQELPANVRQLHSSEYKRPSQLETSHVLLVGSGSSGVQICRELAESGCFQSISLATSGNFTLPWTFLGIPIYTLLRGMGFFRITDDSWLGRTLFPKLRGKGDPATPPSARQLTKTYNVKRFGRVTAVRDSEIVCSDGQTLPTRDLTVIWCTGFRLHYDFLDASMKKRLLDEEGFPIHARGVAKQVSGLYFVGLRFQHTFVSQELYGVGQDASYIAEQIALRFETY